MSRRRDTTQFLPRRTSRKSAELPQSGPQLWATQTSARRRGGSNPTPDNLTGPGVPGRVRSGVSSTDNDFGKQSHNVSGEVFARSYAAINSAVTPVSPRTDKYSALVSPRLRASE